MKQIEGFEDYLISLDGKVFSLKTMSFLKLRKNREGGYFRVELYDGKIDNNKKRKFFSVARLVAKAYLPNPQNKPTVNHIDGNKENNSLLNLEWATYSENRQHCHDNKLHPGNGLKRKIACSNKMIFDSSYQAADWININIFQSKRTVHYIAGKIRACANGNAKTAYKLKFEFVN